MRSSSVCNHYTHSCLQHVIMQSSSASQSLHMRSSSVCNHYTHSRSPACNHYTHSHLQHVIITHTVVFSMQLLLLLPCKCPRETEFKNLLFFFWDRVSCSPGMSPIPHEAKDDPKLLIHLSSAGTWSVSYQVQFLCKYPTHWAPQDYF